MDHCDCRIFAYYRDLKSKYPPLFYDEEGHCICVANVSMATPILFLQRSDFRFLLVRLRIAQIVGIQE